MYNTLLLLGLAALSGDLPPQAAAPSRPAAPVDADGILALSDKLQRAIGAGLYEDALAVTKAIAAHPDFRLMPEEGAAAVHYLTGVLQLQMGRPADALPALVRATQQPGATAEHWRMRLDAESALRDRDATARTMTAMLERFPDSHSQLFDDLVLQLAVSPESDPDSAFALRLALIRSGWSNENDSVVWMKLIDDLLERDRAGEVSPVIARVTSPVQRLQLNALHRYAAVRPAGRVFDVGAAYDVDLERDRARAEVSDATLEHRSDYLDNLLMRGRLEPALALADAILAVPVETTSEGEPDFEAAGQLTWVMDTRARILLLLGRADEGVAQQRTAAGREEYSRPNVSQTINLGHLLVRVGRFGEAVAALAALTEESVSAFGWMQTQLVRACAAYELSDEAMATPAFTHLEANWRDAPSATYAALACRGDEEGMARLLHHILSDPEHQSIGVALMHRYLDAAARTEFDGRVAERHRRVTARPDVVAARDAVALGFDVPTIGPQF